MNTTTTLINQSSFGRLRELWDKCSSKCICQSSFSQILLYLLLCYSVSYQYIYCCPSSTHYNNSGVLYQFVVPCAPGVHAQQCLPLRRFSAQPPINALFASTPLLHLILFCTRTCWHYHKCVICSILIFCSSKSVQNSLYNGRFFLTTYSTFSLLFMTLLVPSPQLHRIATLSRYNFWY